MRFVIAFAAFSLLCSATIAQAAADKLTEDAIRAHFKEMEEVQMKSAEEVVAFYDKHSASTIRSILNISKRSMGQDMEPEVIDMNKTDMLDRIKTAHTKLKPDFAKLEVISIEIAPDGKTAKVKENLYGRFTLTGKTEQGETSIPAEQSVLCDDKLAIENGVILMTESMCEIKATIGEVSGLAADKAQGMSLKINGGADVPASAEAAPVKAPAKTEETAPKK